MLSTKYMYSLKYCQVYINLIILFTIYEFTLVVDYIIYIWIICTPPYIVKELCIYPLDIFET